MEFLKSQWMPHKAPRVVAELRFKVVTSAVKSLDKRRDGLFLLEIFIAADGADGFNACIHR